MRGAAITDHGLVAGWEPFAKAMQERGLIAVRGIEAYQAKVHRAKRPDPIKREVVSKKTGRKSTRLHHPNDAFHVVLLAQNDTGQRNLKILSQLANDPKVDYRIDRPRLDWELLEQYNEGVICTSACMGGLVSDGIKSDDLTALNRYLQIFGDRFFIELHAYRTQEQHEVNEALMAIAQERGIPMLAVSDAHFACQEDYLNHEALLTAQMGPPGASEGYGWKSPATGQMRHHPPDLWIMDNQSMYNHLSYLGDRVVHEAMANTVDLLESCRNVTPVERKLHLPRFVQAEEVKRDVSNSKELLLELMEEGLVERYGEDLPDEVVDRATFEFKAITEAFGKGERGLEDYFLITWDLINWCDRQGILTGPGRGSAAGSVLAYALGITDVDPIRYGLYFERFWNPGRTDGLPDIDNDVPQKYRGVVKDYLSRRWGYDNVRDIGTHVRMGPKAAIDRALKPTYGTIEYDNATGRPKTIVVDSGYYAAAEVIKKHIETLEDAGKQPEWQDEYNDEGELIREGIYTALSEELKPFIAEYPELFETAEWLTGRISTYGVHASAVILSDEPLTGLMASRLAEDKDEGVRKLVTQIDMHEVEANGFLKLDILGLRNLDTLMETLALTEEHAGKNPNDVLKREVDWDNLPDEMWNLLTDKLTLGLFQIEDGHAARKIAKEMHAKSLEDLGAIVALNRPGPLRSGMVDHYFTRRAGEEPIVYQHEILEDISDATYGMFCIAGSSLITDAESGRRHKIADLGSQIGMLVHGGTENGPQIGRVVGWFPQGVKKVVSVKTSDGSAITMTPDHKVLTETGWKAIADVGVGGFVAAPKEMSLSAPDAPASDDHLLILAYLIGDGSFGKSGCTFFSKDEILVQAFCDAVCRSFPRLNCHKSLGIRDVVRVSPRLSRTGEKGNGLNLLVRECGLWEVKSRDKFVPSFVFSQPREQIQKFVAYLWDTDGGFAPCTASYKTISRGLAVDLRDLLLRIGITSSIYESTYESASHGLTTAYQVTVSDPLFLTEVVPFMKNRGRADVGFSPSKNQAKSTVDRCIAHRLLSETGLTKRSIEREYGYGRAGWTRTSRVSEKALGRAVVGISGISELTSHRWVEVLSIEEAGEEEVFDISVEGPHSFVADGLLVHNCYQEQVIAYFRKIGYSLGEADDMRSILGKKKVKKMHAEHPRYMERAVSAGMTEKQAETIWQEIIDFSKYSFNLAHAISYGKVLLWTMWAKYHHPVEFILASIRTVKSKGKKTATERIGEYVNEGKRMGVSILGPDINVSEAFTSKVGDDIYFGLSSVKGVNETAADWIVANRPFTSFDDLIEKLDAQNKAYSKLPSDERPEKSPKQLCGRGALNNLLNAGAFDALHEEYLYCEKRDVPQKRDPSKTTKRDVVDVCTQRERATMEEELTGIVFQDLYSGILEDNIDKIDGCLTVDEVGQCEVGEKVRCYGIVSDVDRRRLKEGGYNGGKEYSLVSINWNGANCRAAAWPGVHSTLKGFLLKKGTLGVFDIEVKERGLNLLGGERLS